MSEQQEPPKMSGVREPLAAYTSAPAPERIPAVPRVSAAEMAEYRVTARHRWQQEQQQAAQKKAQAWNAARRAAALLKSQFGASRVAVFGSLVREGSFTRWSDVDIAAWGISPQDTFRAIGAVLDLDPEIEVNLVDVGVCRPSLLAGIERAGMEL